MVPFKAEPPIQEELFQENPKRKKSRLSWADLLKRTFQIDMSICVLCGGHLKFSKAVIKRDEIVAILKTLGPPPAPA